jgi:hypothetical protein
MTGTRGNTGVRVALGFRAVKGGAVVVGIAVDGGEPRVVLSRVVPTGEPGDSLSLGPYAVAAELYRSFQGDGRAEAAATVAEGRRRQERAATDALRAIIRELEEATCRPSLAALLVNRADWITDVLEYSLAWREHVPVAEGLAVRDALRFAFKECRIEFVELDEKSLPELAATTFGTSSASIDTRVKALGVAVGKPWRKEQKLACLSAWLALTAYEAVSRRVEA